MLLEDSIALKLPCFLFCNRPDVYISAFGEGRYLFEVSIPLVAAGSCVNEMELYAIF